MAQKEKYRDELQGVAPELRAAAQQMIQRREALGGLEDIDYVRSAHDQGIEKNLSGLSPDSQVEVQDHYIQVAGDNRVIWVRTYAPTKSAPLKPGLIWMHGGGLLLGRCDQDEKLLRKICKTAGCFVVSVNYRLAPEYPYPCATVDARAALHWLHEIARAVGVSPSRIVVGGASAGGGLAASIAISESKQGNSTIAKQILIYPMLNNKTADRPETASTLIWSQEDNTLAWKHYLPNLLPNEEAPLAAAPGTIKDAKGLAPAFIAVGDIDLFFLESLNYATSLVNSGVGLDMQVYRGAFHGFLSVAPHTLAGEQCFTAIVQAIVST
jgi:acetyl esterase/lipase